MESIGKNKSLIELYLISCGIGKNHKDINFSFYQIPLYIYLNSFHNIFFFEYSYLYLLPQF